MLVTGNTSFCYLFTIITIAVFSIEVTCKPKLVFRNKRQDKNVLVGNVENNLGPDEICLQCICEAVSYCNVTNICDEDGSCGPFRITKPFWIDAGKPILRLDDAERPEAFTRCAFDLTCAGKAVFEYMKKYKLDCNGDGEINCVDYARIHRYGSGDFCKKELDIFVKEDLFSCLNETIKIKS
ncbi:invertebrate-type lysozyme 3-like [Lycorma delicatula]|uniref:invertebrate-type lysozyme 3-like n=1 Tax=Lycorma delicatula TaxID=130591 RepID=UPI003F50F2E7